MALNINFASWLRFSFLVWVKSVFLILICLGLYLIATTSQGLDFRFLGSAMGFSILAFLYTTPFFIIMLVFVYLINRSTWSITIQKFIIAAIYTSPIIIFALYIRFNEVVEIFEFLTMIALLIIPTLIMIYFTKLLPSKEQQIDSESRSDVIDDISFED